MNHKKYVVVSDSGIDIDGENVLWYPLVDKDGNLYDWSVGLHKNTPSFFSKNRVKEFLTQLQGTVTHVNLEIIQIVVPKNY